MKLEKILILDFGSQYSQLIARRIRELGVYCELHPGNLSAEAILAFEPKGIILSGGPATANYQSAPQADDSVFTLGCPVLGICYGMQTMAFQLGGNVANSDMREFGLTKITIHHQSPLFEGIFDPSNRSAPNTTRVWMSHGDEVTDLPQGFTSLASSDSTAIVAMADETRRLYALQFHPEVTHTEQGKQLLASFIQNVCHIVPQWTPKNIAEELIFQIRQQVGGEKVLLALSGGVDSSVVAALLNQAIGKQLYCIFVDTGFLRKGEVARVKAIFADYLDLQIIYVDAAEQFITALQGIADPEIKRKTIGKLFIDVFENQVKQLNDVQWLAQGTIYSDVIESGATSLHSETIKSHHNVGGLPKNLSLKLIEPLRELFKDEVRQLGEILGLPAFLLYQHPFPGPGLAVRVLGQVTADHLACLREADAIFIEALHQHRLYDQVSQAFAVFLPIKSVAVKGDNRCYENVVTLRAVVTTDFMTAHCAALPHEFITSVANRIMNEVPGISRVTYDISSKPPATIEWE